jgi:hypothetical protein
MNYREEFEIENARKYIFIRSEIRTRFDAVNSELTFEKWYSSYLETKLTERDKEIKRLNTILDDLRHEKQTATNLKRRQR